MVKDSWVHVSRASREESILRLLQGVIGVPELVSAWTVQIEGIDDKTDMRRFPLPYFGEVQIHHWLLMMPVTIPISEFESVWELLSVFIDILDGTSEQQNCLSANLTMRTVHERLVVEFSVLHCDVSFNNAMMYASTKKKASGRVKLLHKGDNTHSDIPGDGTATGKNMGDETREQRLARWDQERRKMIQDGILRGGLLIDFDYATLLDQSLPVVPGDRTVSFSLFICTCYSSTFRVWYHSCHQKFFLALRKTQLYILPTMT